MWRDLKSFKRVKVLMSDLKRLVVSTGLEVTQSVIREMKACERSKAFEVKWSKGLGFEVT
jgi:hypothetical protein